MYPANVEAHTQEKIRSILNFWHKVEFFIPFDLESQLSEVGEGTIRRYYSHSLAPSFRGLWQTIVPSDFQLKHFYLYLGSFDKSEIVRVCSSFDHTERGLNHFADSERTTLEGLTCFARLRVLPNGDLPPDSDIDAVSVSTLPWALGQLQSGGFTGLTHGNFQQAREQLVTALQNFRATRQLGPLQPLELSTLHELFCQWASFSPTDNKPEFAIEPFLVKKKQQTPGGQSESASTPDAAEEDSDDEPGGRIGILNSFFIEDIERAVESLDSGHFPPVLESYFATVSPEEQINLESEHGLQAILDALHPSRLNRGRWFTAVNRRMTLMAQFAINTALPAVDPPALFSVNGPPGTGKTTLLQDVIAELIVRRARVLSQLKDAKSAFEPDVFPAQFKAQTVMIMQLKPELTGFEMVVASSNNRAVENISHDFLKTGVSLGDGWSAATFLRPVAYKIAAQKANGKIEDLEPGEEPWGLIACKLGRSRNRYAFKERFAFPAKEEQQRLDLCPLSQTIYQWIDSYQGPTFAEAAATFKTVEETLEQKLAHLANAASLLGRKLDNPHLIGALELSIRHCRAEKERAIGELQAIRSDLDRLQLTSHELREDERLIERSYPGWWPALRRTPAAKAYKAGKQENARRQLAIRGQLAQVRERHAAVNAALHAANAHLQEAELQKRQAEEDDHALQDIFAGAQVPSSLADLNSEIHQKDGLWHTEELAQLRSSLFAAALALHEAWLAEVARKKGGSGGGAGFRANVMAITTLLSNKIPEQPSAALAVWQSLFMIVPVVSTTFASFAAQFRNIPPASLGWLLIDEAGQAVPQAAVGALWRSRHAIVVGDPRQIEPVFTLPSRFIATLAALAPETANGDYSPHQTSVQRLADRANRFGVFSDQSGELLWLGSPLRVHRRCIEPMFSWANEIAYSNKMVYGLPDRTKPNGPPIPIESVWIEMAGRAAIQQAVPEQTNFVIDLVQGLYRRDGKLPTNLYVISAFKAVKNHIVKTMLGADWAAIDGGTGPALRELREWCGNNVGTVHTFQGKEEDSVLMVLGADQQQQGAAQWAAIQPNLLNVALTRAKRRFYLLGERQLWGAIGSFRWANGNLDSITPEAFLSLVSPSTTAKAPFNGDNLDQARTLGRAWCQRAN